MKFWKSLGVFLFIATAAARVEASDSLGFDVLGGVGTSGFDTNGSLDIKAADVKNPYEASLSYAHQYTTFQTESRTNQYTLGLDHAADDNWNGHSDLTYWNDSINQIHYGGGTAGLTYTWNEGEAPRARTAPAKSRDADSVYSLQEQEGLAKGEDQSSAAGNEMSTDPAPKDEIGALTLNADLFVYGTEVEASSTTRKVFDRKLNRYVKEVVPPQTGTAKTTQAHPYITHEKPLFDSQATPYLTVGHYFYSKNPAAIEALAGRPRFAASAGRINGLVGGFLNNNGEIGTRVSLPFDLESDFRLGAAQEVTDNTWATTQGVTLTRIFFDHVKVKLDWSRAIQGGVSDDLFTGGVTYTF